MQKMTLRDRKRQLTREIVDRDVEASYGKLLTTRAVITVAVTRILLAVYEIIYFSIANVEINVWSLLLILPGLLILYMISDGNKALAGILTIAGAVRLLLLFASTLITLPKNAGGIVYISVAGVILLSQAILSSFVSINEKCNSYALAMRKVNMRVQAEFLSGRR